MTFAFSFRPAPASAMPAQTVYAVGRDEIDARKNLAKWSEQGSLTFIRVIPPAEMEYLLLRDWFRRE